MFSDFFCYSAQEFQWKSQRINRNYQNYSFFYFFAFFMKIVGIWTVFIADMNSACKNALISIFLLILLIRHNYLQFFHRLFPWIKLIFSKIWKFLILLYLSSFPSKKHVSLFFWYSAQEFLWKSQRINRNYQNYSFFYFFAFFMKIVGIWTVFIADMNTACKNTLISIFL